MQLPLLQQHRPACEAGTCEYTSRVNAALVCPSCSDTTFGETPKGPTPLKGKLIGLSISDAPDLAERSMGQVHLEDAMVECARHLLVQGASLGYGGDLRPGGFTEILFELVRTHNRAGTKERIHNFLSWPIHLRVDPAAWHEYLDEIHDYKFPPPPDLRLS